MSAKDAFKQWLTTKLKSLNTDESVFGEYILGILEGDETKDEKREALEGILSAIIVREFFSKRNHQLKIPRPIDSSINKI